MSFGWGVGDILTGIDLVKIVPSAIRNGPAEYQEMFREPDSLKIVLRSVQEGDGDPTLLLNRKG